jgi:predicted nucleotidyltransferase
VAVARAAEALSRLVDTGVLERRRAGRAYLYSLNETNYLVSDGLIPAFRSEAEWIERLGNEVYAVLERKADAVILYGSWARHQPTPTSDVDLLVVTRRGQDQDKIERILEEDRGRLAERFGRPVSLLVVGRDELRRRLRRGDQLMREIIREGRTVAGKSIAEVVGGA